MTLPSWPEQTRKQRQLRVLHSFACGSKAHKVAAAWQEAAAAAATAGVGERL
jgi:hypothetical protein